jgi:nucleoside-diphosphate-sugar epimerase
MRILSIGGSGFVSGELARQAVAAGHEVTVITRGQRPPVPGVQSLVADRQDDQAMAAALASVSGTWDLAVDCIGYRPEDARQDLALLRDRAQHLVFISTDFVFDPVGRRFPQGEESGFYLHAGYGGQKRLAELELLHAPAGSIPWTVLRPCHIFGTGRKLGVLPSLREDPKDLVARFAAGTPCPLVGGGLLQQPIYVRDLVATILSCAGNTACQGRIFQAAGPDIMESREYYRIMAVLAGLPFVEQELSQSEWLAKHPGDAVGLCHRIYNLDSLRQAGLAVPSTPFVVAMRQTMAELGLLPVRAK